MRIFCHMIWLAGIVWGATLHAQNVYVANPSHPQAPVEVLTNAPESVEGAVIMRDPVFGEDVTHKQQAAIQRLRNLGHKPEPTHPARTKTSNALQFKPTTVKARQFYPAVAFEPIRPDIVPVASPAEGALNPKPDELE